MDRMNILLLILVICGHRTGASLTEQQKTGLLKHHNDARIQVDPTAADMVKLRWSDALAEKAQDWADTCTDGHNPVYSDDRWSWIGENMAFSSRGNLQNMVENWVGENVIYEYGNNTCSPVPGNALLSSCGHYTQVVWANSEFLGCGYVAGCPGYFSDRLVCNYGPGGNYKGQKPYTEGKVCSVCPNGYGDCSDGLCIFG